MSQPRTRPQRSRWFIPALCIGWVFIVIGAVFAFTSSADSKPITLIAYVIAFDLVHDAVIAPLVILGGWLIGRLVPPFARGPVRAATALTVLIVIFAAPLLGKFGERPTNSSALTLPYARNTLIVVATIWVSALLIIVKRRQAAPAEDRHQRHDAVVAPRVRR